MKKLIMLLVLGFCSDHVFAEGIMSKQSLLETMESTFEESLCTKTYNTCMNTTKTACFTEVKRILNKECSADIPDELEDIDEVRAYAGSTGACTTKKYLKNHKAAIKKNAKTPACQSILKK